METALDKYSPIWTLQRETEKFNLQIIFLLLFYRLSKACLTVLASDISVLVAHTDPVKIHRQGISNEYTVSK
jgi:hypothetical protein